MKIIPSGKGVWIWKAAQCEKGNWNAIVSKCKAAGIKWIAAKSGDNDRYPGWTSAHLKNVIQLCHDNGILFGTWNYSLPITCPQQVSQIKSLFDDGIDFAVLDAEIEWQTFPNANVQAESFMQSLRAAVGDVFIAHSPFAIPNYHASFPYVGFGKYVDAVMIQSYWTEFNWPVQQVISQADASWAAFNKAHPEAAKPVWPIGVTYGQGYPGVKGPLTPDSIKTFINHYGDIPISFYSYDAAFPMFWDVMNASNASNMAPTPPQQSLNFPAPPEPVAIPPAVNDVQAPVQEPPVQEPASMAAVQQNPQGILNIIMFWIIKLFKQLFNK